MQRGASIHGLGSSSLTKSRNSFRFLSSSVSPCSSVLVPDQVVPQGKIYGQSSESIDQEERRSMSHVVGLLNS